MDGMKQLKRAARKHSEKEKCPLETKDIAEIRAFIAGAKWQAEKDSAVAVEASREHLKGGFFALGTTIARAIEMSVEE